MPKKKIIDHYHHGDLKVSLIKTALKMLETQSPIALSLRELAKKAGVSQSAPYRHFKDKDELINAICTEAFEIKLKLMQEAMIEAKGDPLQTYFGCGISYFRMGLKHPQHFKLMFSELCSPDESHPELQRVAATTFALVREMVLIAQKGGVIGPGDPYHIAMNCWCVVNGYTVLYANGKMDWLGVTPENAESGLKILLQQMLVGLNKGFGKTSQHFKLFKTPESSPHLEMMNQILF
ncbi:MAG: TetR/AcrR family transcriptional regulator [Xanthomonadaceae bacterium]|nr:TetR/AcrR family transcriptional regulator [Xanthomonadaceae bacterium]